MDAGSAPVFEMRRDGLLVSTDPARLDFEAVHGWISRSYWAAGIPREVVDRSIRHSFCFGLYEQDGGAERQVGFARVITDRATYAYLCDVFILETHRARGLSKWLIRTILDHPDLQGLRRFCLLTWDAQTLYSRFGFKHLEEPKRYMEIRNADVYKRATGQAGQSA